MTINCVWEHNGRDTLLYAVDFVPKALEKGYTVDRIHELSKITPWFLEKLKNIVDYTKVLSAYDKICLLYTSRCV